MQAWKEVADDAEADFNPYVLQRGFADQGNSTAHEDYTAYVVPAFEEDLLQARGAQH